MTAKIEPIIIIRMISCNGVNIVDTPRGQALFSEPFKDLTEHIIVGLFGALTPGAVATPRQSRPPARLTRWGGAWASWTATPRRGLPHGAYRYLVDTRTMLVARVGV